MKNIAFILLAFVLFACTSTNSTETNLKLVVKNQVDHVHSLAREPMVCEHSDGTLFVTGYKNDSGTPQLWKSSDGGSSWESVNVGTQEEGAIGNSDVDLFIDAKGNIYLLSMTYTIIPDNTENFDFSTTKGERVVVGVSRDAGESWNWQTISENDYDDRPWITATTDGTLHIIWNDGSGVHRSISKDDGASWEKVEDVSSVGGSSFLANGANGQLAVRITPLSASGFQRDPGVDLIKLSLDNGSTWSDVSIPGNLDWPEDYSGVPRWVEPIAWDKENRFYSLWSEGQQLKLGVSEDSGSTWQEFEVMQNVDTMYYPYLEVSDQGLLCTWMSGFTEDVKHNAAVIKVQEDGIQTYLLEPQTLDVWSRFTSEGFSRSTGGEYFPIIPLANGNFGMATTIQNSKDNRDGFTWWELELKEVE
ncbi:MAG: sialidase family protein [Bacteroidota bacterium]